MKKFGFLLLLFVLRLPCGVASNNGDYFRIDTITYSGVNLINEGLEENNQFCYERIKGGIKKYGPNKVSEYGFDGKLVYVAQDIYLDYAWKRVFLEKNQIGSIALYCYSSGLNQLFFIQKGKGPLVELNNEPTSKSYYKNLLASWTSDFPLLSSKSSKVLYTRESLIFFLKEYDARKLLVFAPASIGVTMGLSQTKMLPLVGHFDPDFQIFDYKYESSVSVGFQIIQPIFQFGFSILAECNYSNVTFSDEKLLVYHAQNPYLAGNYEYEATLHMLELPLQLRYTLPLRFIRPYVEAGCQVSWNIINTCSVKRASYQNGEWNEFGRVFPTIFDKFQVGSSIGCGLEYPIGVGRTLFLEMRVVRAQGVLNPELSKLSRFDWNAGFTF